MHFNFCHLSACFACILLLFAYIDINECSNTTLNVCDPNANCSNIDGGYICTCLDGYMGDGEICQGMISSKHSTHKQVILSSYLE